MNLSKSAKGKPITTSVPSFAIRFHASGEELEELYPSEEDDKQTNEEKCADSSPADQTKQESSPLRDCLNKLGKRSCSIDAGINDTSQQTSPDPWRIFTEFKGKLTKTVEEKLSEIKSKSNDLDNSPKFGDSKYKQNSKDNSSISDSEDHSFSECSVPMSVGLSSTAGDIEMSSEDDESLVESDKTPTEQVKGLQSCTISVGLRNRKFNPKSNVNVSYKKTDEEISLNSVTSEKTEDIESGVEACEDLTSIASNEDVDSAETLLAPKGFVDLRFTNSSSSSSFALISNLASFWTLFVVFISIILLYLFPIYMIGFLCGGILAMCSCVYYYFMYMQNELENLKLEMKSESKEVKIVQIPAAKEYHPVMKLEGWLNEYPEMYNPYTYHISMTQSVYLKLEGNILRISHTNSKIPKRAMWNEKKIKVAFTHHRIYNLKGSEIILLPRGLIHKRIWSKKYPICIVFNKEYMFAGLPVLRKTKEEDIEKELKEAEQFVDNQKLKQECEDKNEVEDLKESLLSVDGDDEEETCITEEWDTLNYEETNVETKIYLFTRTGRDKEEWFRRLVAATSYNTQTETKNNETLKDNTESDAVVTPDVTDATNSVSLESTEESTQKSVIKEFNDNEEYQQFITHLLQEIKCVPNVAVSTTSSRKHLVFRKKKFKSHISSPNDSDIDDDFKDKENEPKPSQVEDELSSELLWFNVIIGRISFDMFKNDQIIAGMQDRIQRKLSTIKLPYFIEEIVMSDLQFGREGPCFQKIHQPYLDERGLWIDMDLTFEGLIKMSLVTKLNLMKLKEQAGKSDDTGPSSPRLEETRSPMFYSDIEDSAESSSDDERVIIQPVTADTSQDGAMPKGKKFLRMVDKIASSKYFQHATEYKYIKRAMEGVSKTELKLTVEIRCLKGRLAVNISTPPTDRIWIGFRGNPKLILTAKPAFGERSINFVHVTRWIERKLCQEFQKVLVIPNMEDLVCPLMNSNLPK